MLNGGDAQKCSSIVDFHKENVVTSSVGLDLVSALERMSHIV